MEAYRKPEKGLGGVKRYSRAHNLTRKEALAKLQRDDVYTLHKPIHKHFRKRSYIATHIGDLYQADLLYLSKYKRFNRGYRYVLTVIDSLSRYLYMAPLKSKPPQDVKKAFVRVFRHGTPKHLLADRGTEFFGKIWRVYEEKTSKSLLYI